MIQVIRWLVMGLASQTKAEKKFCADTPLARPTDGDGLRKAIRILEASSAMSEAMLEPLGDAFCMSYGGNVSGLKDPDYLAIAALIKASIE